MGSLTRKVRTSSTRQSRQKPDRAMKILNRAYLHDKPYSDIVLHLQREMRVNGLGAPNKTTLVLLRTPSIQLRQSQKENKFKKFKIVDYTCEETS